MKRFLFLLSLSAACAAAAADGPWISVGASGPLRPGEGAWTDDVLRVALDEGSATVVADAGGWTLLLDGALADGSGDPDGPSGIRFDGGDAGLPLDVGLSGRNVLLGGGVRAENCSLLSVRGPGSLRVDAGNAEAFFADGDLSFDGATVAAVRGNGDAGSGAVACGGDLSVADSVVASFDGVPSGGGGTALRAGGNVSVSGSAVLLFGTGGIQAENVDADASFLGIASDAESVLAGDSAVFADSEGLLLSGGNAVSAGYLEFRSGNDLVVAGNGDGGAAAALRQTSKAEGVVHSGGTTRLFAPGGTGVDAQGTVLVEGGSLSVSAGPGGVDPAAFFAADSASAAAAAFAPGIDGGSVAAVLAAFFADEAVSAFLGRRAVPVSAGLPASGIRARNVLVEGGTTVVQCRTAAAGIVAAESASRTGGTATVNGADWPPPYKIVFKANGGKGSMKSLKTAYDRAAKLPKNAFRRDGFAFAGWSRTPEGPAEFKNKASVRRLTAAGGKVPLYAQWAKKKYSVKFLANGGTGKMSPLSMEWGKSRSLPANAFVRGGFWFRGWALSKKDAASGIVAYKDGKTVKNLVTRNGTVKLYAVWKKFVPKTAGRIRIALCQTPTRPSSAAAQVDATFAWARANLRGDEDLIVFPELAFAPFTELKTAWKRGPGVWKKVAAFARERRAWIVANHPNRPSGGSKTYNETRVYAPDGTVRSVYRKRVLARMDSKAGFSSGATDVVLDLPFARVGHLICKDAFTPSKGIDRYKRAEVLLVQFAHPGVDDRSAPEAKGFPTAAKSLSDLRKSRNGWRKLGRPYMAVNKSGPDGNYTLCGGTFAADKSGKIVAKAGAAAAVVFVDFPLRANGRIKPTPVPVPAD